MCVNYKSDSQFAKFFLCCWTNWKLNLEIWKRETTLVTFYAKESESVFLELEISKQNKKIVQDTSCRTFEKSVHAKKEQQVTVCETEKIA